MHEAGDTSLTLTPPEEALVAYLWRDTAPDVAMWPALVEAARHHGMLASVAFLATQEKGLPADLQVRLRDVRYHAGIFHIRAEKQLRQLGALAQELETPLILLKGPVTARAYPFPEARAFGDLDLFAPSEERARRLEAALIERGYVSHADSRTGHLPPLQPSEGGLRVELHCNAAEILPALRADVPLWNRARPVPGLPGLLALAPVDHALYITVHALEKHGLDMGLRAVYDYGCWVQRWDDATWADLRAQMTAQRLEPHVVLLTALWGWARGIPWEQLPLAASSPPPPEILTQALEALLRRDNVLLPTVWRDLPQGGLRGWLAYARAILTAGGTLRAGQLPHRILYLLRTHGPGLFRLLRGDSRTRRQWERQHQLQAWLDRKD